MVKSVRSFNLGFGVIALCMLAQTSAIAKGLEFTELGVRQLYTQVAAAFNRGDIDSVLATIAADARLETRDRDNKLISLEPFDKSDYRRAMRELWASVSDYQLSIEIHAVHIDEDGRAARVLHTITERWQDTAGWQVLVTPGHTQLVNTTSGPKADYLVVWVGPVRHAI